MGGDLYLSKTIERIILPSWANFSHGVAKISNCANPWGSFYDQWGGQIMIPCGEIYDRRGDNIKQL